MSLTSPVSCTSNAFLFITLLAFGFTIFAIISRIKFVLDSRFLQFLSSDKSDLFFLLNFLQFMSSDKSDFLDYESDNDGSDSGSAGTWAFNFSFDEYVGCVGKSVGRVSGVGSGVFVPR